MKYIIEAFDKETEQLAYEIALPDGCDTQLAAIMGWVAPQRGDEGYNLTSEQVAAIEVLANRTISEHDHILQLTCNID